MQLDVRSAALAAMLIIFPIAAYAQQASEESCMRVANVLLRERPMSASASVKAGKMPVIQCLCAVDPQALQNYVSACTSGVSADNMRAYNAYVQHSACSDPNSPAMQNCLQ